MEVLFWIALCFGVGYFAKSKGRSALAWGIASVFFSPLLCGVIVALMKDKKQIETVDKVAMEHQQLKDRVSANEIKTNQQFQKLENSINGLQTEKLYGNDLNLIESEFKACPACGEKIKRDAIKCRYCDADLSEIKLQECPFCKELIRIDAVKCKFCRSNLSVNNDTIVKAEVNTKCPYCHEAVSEDSKFCNKCGTKL